MASYLQGITDNPTQPLRFEPDLNFYAGVLQRKQSEYDANFQKLSGMYSTGLNGPLTADVNIQRRDQYFKDADAALKSISKLDLTQAANMKAAENIFKPFYADENITSDRAWTEKFNNAWNTGEALRHCTDPKKCPEQHWEEGDQYLQYKRLEFKNADDKTRLDLARQSISYIPKIDIDSRARELAKEMDLNVSKDEVSGQWIVTHTNGSQTVPYWQALFNSEFAGDDRIQGMYKAKAYVSRNNFIHSGQAGSPEEAEKIWIGQQMEVGKAQTEQISYTTNQHIAATQERINNLKAKLAKGQGLLPEEQYAMDHILPTYLQQLNSKKDDNDRTAALYTVGISGANLDVLRNRAEGLYANSLLTAKLDTLAETISHKGEKTSIKDNPYALASYNSALSQGKELTVQEQRHKDKMEEDWYKYNLEHGANGSTGDKLKKFPGEGYDIKDVAGSSLYDMTHNELTVKSNQNKGAMIKMIMDIYNTADLSKSTGAQLAKSKL